MDRPNVGGTLNQTNLLMFPQKGKESKTNSTAKTSVGRIEVRTLPLRGKINPSKKVRTKNSEIELPKLNALTNKHSMKQMVEGLEIKLLRLKELSRRLDYYVQELEDWHSIERKD